MGFHAILVKGREYFKFFLIFSGLFIASSSTALASSGGAVSNPLPPTPPALNSSTYFNLSASITDINKTQDIIIKFNYRTPLAQELRGGEYRDEMLRVVKVIADNYMLSLIASPNFDGKIYEALYPRMLSEVIESNSTELEIREARRATRLELKKIPAAAVPEITEDGMLRQVTIQLSGIYDIDRIIADLSASSYLDNENFLIEFAKKNELVSFAFSGSDPNLPNDPGYLAGDQSYSLTAANVEAAWTAQQGNTSIVIAVVDTGVRLTHFDLAANIWVNAADPLGDADGDGNPDDDGNSFVDDIKGWNFVAGNNQPADDQGHGTMVSGLIAAVGDNNYGITGMCPNCKILPVRVGYNFNGTPATTTALVIQGIEYAIDQGVDIINLSLYSPDSISFKQVIAEAEANGITVVAAAGNNKSTAPQYPAAYDTVLGVAAVDHLNALWNPTGLQGSNTGPWVNLAAPGVDITTTVHQCGSSTNNNCFIVQNRGKTGNSGTSFSAAIVSGAAALILSDNTRYTPAAVRHALLRNLAPVSPALENQFYPGFGVLDTGSALLWDKDGDGTRDTVDNCIGIANANQNDSDLDGYGDVCDPDLNQNGTGGTEDYYCFWFCEDPTPSNEWMLVHCQLPDWNQDGLLNLADVQWGNVCDAADINKDGIVDWNNDTSKVLKPVINSANFMPLWDGIAAFHVSGRLGLSAYGHAVDSGLNISYVFSDNDRDGYAYAVDNCPEVTNQRQEDSDNDGIGDACDNN